MAVFNSDIGNGYRIILNIIVTSQDIAANKSTCMWLLQIENGHTYYNDRHTGSVIVDGVSVWSEPDGHFNSGSPGSIKTIASGYRTLVHNVDGTKTLSFSANLKTVVQGMGWSLPMLTISDTYFLPTIPRYPGAPGEPTYSVDHEGRKITVTSPPVSSVTSILEYQIERRHYTMFEVDPSDWIVASADSRRQITFSTEDGQDAFEFRSRARTAAGWGPYSPITMWIAMWKPKVLGALTITQNPSTREVTVTLPEGDASGNPITQYQVRIRTNWPFGNWTIHSVDLNTRTYKFTPVMLLTQYDFQGRAATFAGWGDWGTTFYSIDGAGSGPRVMVSGVYRRSNAFVKEDGVWRPAIAWVKHNGVWKQALR